MMTNNEMVERYYELNKLMRHSEYSLSDDEIDEWNYICENLLYEILKANKDVFERLKDR